MKYLKIIIETVLIGLVLESKTNLDNFNIAISTVNKISQVLKIRPPQVYLNDSQDFPNPHVSSMYVSSKDSIVFNSSWIDQVDVMEVVATATGHQFYK
jgi:hypothetical protein